jgi:hypothetical protein
MEKFLKVFCLFLMSALLFACSATYNWREIRNDEQNFVALFPSKASAEQHNVHFEDTDLTMTMVAAMADDALFAVGTMPFDPTKIKSEKLVNWMQTNTAKLIQGDDEPKSISFDVKTAQNPPEMLTGSGMNLKGLGPDGIYRLYWVRWVIRKDPSGASKVFQLSALKPFKKTPTPKEQEQATEQFETFMGGFHPY